MTARWIDAHVHLFPSPAEDLPRMPRHGSSHNLPSVYFDALAGDAPAGVVIVHFSKAPDNRHVTGALNALKGRPVVGVIKAVDARVFEDIVRPDVRGVRIYAKESVPDFSDTQRWNRLWNLVRSGGKHIALFGEAPYLRKAAALLPQDIPLVIDHLGMPDAEKGISDPAWNQLLADMKSRNRHAPVYFKGPGYRTSLRVEKTAPFARAIVEALGTDRLILGASDAPFAGPSGEQDVRFRGKPLGELADLHWMRDYTRRLAREVGQAAEDQLLYRNAAALYGFQADV